jgi:hypothetical protein
MVLFATLRSFHFRSEGRLGTVREDVEANSDHIHSKAPRFQIQK